MRGAAGGAAGLRVLVVDCHDSYTWNLWQVRLTPPLLQNLTSYYHLT